MPEFVSQFAPRNSEMQDVANAVHPSIVGLTEFSVKLGDDCMALSAEWAEFLSRRLQSDIDLPVRLAGCGCPDSFMQAWSDFVMRAAQDYQREFERLADLSLKLQRNAATPPSLS